VTGTSDSPGDAVRIYYDTLSDGMASFDPDRLRAILAPDLLFEGPIAGRHVGAEPFIHGVGGFAETMRGLKLLHQVRDGRMAATLYDAEMPGGTVRFAEFCQLDAGRIRSIRLVYDAAEYRARGGR
jgi:ketosteroid isomerase-like protein